MVVVSAGRFRMGSPSGEEGRDDDEDPVHDVRISEPFAVGVYEVTVGEYRRFVSATGRGEGDGCHVLTGWKWEKDTSSSWQRPGFSQTERHPVACVSWRDAQAYVEWLSRETGKEYRLLSEAEWEYVARAGTRTRYWWGDNIEQNRANCDGCGSRWDDERTAPVGSFTANGFGLHDIHGNVWEWVEDCWNHNYRGAPTDGSARESGDCSQRVLRGGSWGSIPRDLRSADRIRGGTVIRGSGGGFRVARKLTR